ncbi:Transmembrane protein TauE like [Moorella glycerini]|uniref:Probable membrane transporter protein n=2 Tax=Neomoorella stamsii TaxID=1266720 RepID=A0A9X7J604_9FIRM|nr:MULTISPECIES: sulfite exporter TauE/SafE family protein [Moorella]PRR77559.1 Sulfite exporter TauE/SafE [Moorella stamsii]CEP69394.1 Transmembrane protein TauE like [Moorella glycerini]
MVSLSLTLMIFAGSVLAGVIGALLGLGGGIIIIPLLTLVFGIDIRYAIGASIVSVIATSSGAAAAYIRDRITNIRIGMFLEMATTTGAIVGAFMAGLISSRLLYFIFAFVMGYSTMALFQRRNVELARDLPPHPLAIKLQLAGSYYDQVLHQQVNYISAGVYAGFGTMFAAGILSGLLGIGNGVFKVMAMDMFMKLPMKVSTATSNFMIGITAAASAGIYFARGYINPAITAPVALGVVLGAILGTRLMVRLRNATIRKVFLPVLVYVALQMLIKGIRG